VIKTIGNLFGKDPLSFMSHNLFFQVVRLCNNTVHSAFDNKLTPKQMQEDPELELRYILYKQRVADEVKIKQTISGYSGYQPGNIVLIHVPWEKTKGLFKKQRRNLSELATFIDYDGGNADVQLMQPVPPLTHTRLVIPIFYTKFVAKDASELDPKFRDQLLV
jgi:hypothetical protein